MMSKKAHDRPVGNDPPAAPTQQDTIAVAKAIPAPAANTEDPFFNAENENMEVHHHGHVHHSSKWKEYLFQFFMLFLAVFCGFFAEYQLEHKIENDRAKELAKSFYAELVEDSMRLDRVSALRDTREGSIRLLMDHFEKADLTKDADSVFPHLSLAYLAVSSRVYFEASDGILFQLQNSGSRRYFKGQALQDAISKLATSINFLRLRNEREMTYTTNYLRPFCIKHFDYRWLNEFMEDGKLSITDAFIKGNRPTNVKAHFKNVNKLDRDEAVNIAGNFLLLSRGMKRTSIPDYREAAGMVMQRLREDFKIK